MVAGNNPQSIYNGIGSSNIVINQQLGILVAGHDAELDADNGRGFFAGWNLNTNPVSMKWITYDVPPQPGSNVPLNPNFDAQLIANISQNAGTFYPGKNGTTNGFTTPWETKGGLLKNVNNNIVVDWKHMSPSALNASLYNDWGQSQQTAQCLAIDGGGSTGSTGAWWGGAWVLGSGQSAGMVFVGTNNKDPFAGPCNPGPDLWSASVGAQHHDGRLDMGIPDHRARHLGLRLLVVPGHGQPDHQRREHRGHLEDLQGRLPLRDQRLDWQPHLGMGPTVGHRDPRV